MDKKFMLYYWRDVVEYVKEKTGSQTRRYSMAPYWVHPIAVACLVLKYKASHNIVSLVTAALLHDLVEDGHASIEEIEERFGWLIMSLVQELSSDKNKIKEIGKTKYLSIKMAEMSSWGLDIKLCDRLHNCMDFLFADKTFVEKYSEETLCILEYIEENRVLTFTHRKIISEILKQINLYKN